MIPMRTKLDWEKTLLQLHMGVFQPIINPKLLKRMLETKVLNKIGTRVSVLNQSKLKNPNQRGEGRNKIKNMRILKF
jgi:hypothetical protein|tara:strand:- start:1080 stop:1310 length:231 start_codon:yes stop_codon:yes gene_type:complete